MLAQLLVQVKACLYLFWVNCLMGFGAQWFSNKGHSNGFSDCWLCTNVGITCFSKSPFGLVGNCIVLAERPGKPLLPSLQLTNWVSGALQQRKLAFQESPPRLNHDTTIQSHLCKQTMGLISFSAAERQMTLLGRRAHTTRYANAFKVTSEPFLFVFNGFVVCLFNYIQDCCWAMVCIQNVCSENIRYNNLDKNMVFVHQKIKPH